MSYVEILKVNIRECYTKPMIRKVLKQLNDMQVIAYKEDLLTASEETYVFKNDDNTPYQPNYDADELITSLDNKTNKVIQVLMENEFKSSYTYAALFSFTGNISIPLGNNESILNDFKKITEIELSSTADNSKIFAYSDERDLYLKFPLQITGYLPRENDNKRDILYNIICVINNDEKTLEIRYDKVKSYISALEDNFYVKRVQEVLESLTNLFNIEITPLNMSPIIQHIKASVDNNDDAQNNLVVSAQALNYLTGSKAILDTGNNDDMILPFIGNLKNILATNSELFDANIETLEIKKLLEEIILEAEYLSDHPWITLAWPHDVKSKVLKIKFLFNYLGQDFSVLQYYGNVADAERMTYVTRFIFDNKRELESSQAEQATETESV